MHLKNSKNSITAQPLIKVPVVTADPAVRVEAALPATVTCAPKASRKIPKAQSLAF